MGAVTAPQREVWENASLGRVVIKKYDPSGNIVEEHIPGKRKVHVTPDERRLNQEIAADTKLDVFSNGLLKPVRLLDDETDSKEIKANANSMSEVAMKALFRSQLATFKTKVGEIENTIALERLLEIAREIDASVKQVEAITTRLTELRPKVNETTIIGDSAFGTRAPRGEQGPRGVTPK